MIDTRKQQKFWDRTVARYAAQAGGYDQSLVLANLNWQMRGLFNTLSVFGLTPPVKQLLEVDLHRALHLADFEVFAEKAFGGYPRNLYFVLRKPAISAS